jgi:hypothetical protein
MFYFMLLVDVLLWLGWSADDCRCWPLALADEGDCSYSELRWPRMA